MAQGAISSTAMTTISQTISTTGAIGSGNLDISGITGDWTIKIRVHELTAASGTPSLQIQLEDSVNAFTAVRAQWVGQMSGAQNANGAVGACEKHWSIRKADLPLLRAGTASAVLRLNAIVLGGTTPSCTLDAWMEY